MCEVNLKLIDSGAFSNIYKTTKENTTNKINLKVNFDDNKTICIKLSTLEAGTKEYEYIRQFNHVNVIKPLFGYYDSSINLHVIGMNIYLGNCSSFKNDLNFNSFVTQMIEGIRYIHSMNIVHCDIKPQNILVKRNNSDYIFCITDFNTAYVYKQGNMYKRFRANYNSKSIVGTINFCSIYVLLYCLPYCRDDMESFFITCLFLNSDISESVFTVEQNLTTLRKFRLCMYQYKSIQFIRSYKFYDAIDYQTIRILIIDELSKYTNKQDNK